MNRSSARIWIRRVVPVLLGLAVVVVAIAAWRGAFRRSAPLPTVPLEAVEKRDITVTVQATGTVEPINLIEVKSKASGQILRMPAEIGSVVHTGQLLVQIDSSDVRNEYDQAYAALQAADAKVQVSTAAKKRSDQLYGQQILTADEQEAAVLDLANAISAQVTARTNLDIARQHLADATVRAPSAGTILDTPVAVGTVISSATTSVGGGTTLLTMADLRRIRIRAFVSETDIGSVKEGQSVSVQVDAYPSRQFQGVVEKIEPQSVVQQSVTMFPVLVSISNEEGLLLPGMNGEVTILIQERDAVPSVSLDAVRTMREIPAVAGALGMDADSLRAAVQAQIAARFGNGGAHAAAGGDSVRGQGQGAGRWGASGAGGGSRQHAGGPGQGGGAGRGMYTSAAGGGRMGAGAGGGRAGDAASGGGAGGGGKGNGGSKLQVVFVATPQGLEPRIVRLGVTNYDYAEVLDGVKEGDQVALLSVAELQAKRNQNLSNLRQRMGSMTPGVGGGTGRPAGGGGGGGPRGG